MRYREGREGGDSKSSRNGMNYISGLRLGGRGGGGWDMGLRLRLGLREGQKKGGGW